MEGLLFAGEDPPAQQQQLGCSTAPSAGKVTSASLLPQALRVLFRVDFMSGQDRAGEGQLPSGLPHDQVAIFSDQGGGVRLNSVACLGVPQKHQVYPRKQPGILSLPSLCRAGIPLNNSEIYVRLRSPPTISETMHPAFAETMPEPQHSPPPQTAAFNRLPLADRDST